MRSGRASRLLRGLPEFPANKELAAELLTGRDVARRAKVSKRTVENWVQKGIIPSLKIGGVRRFIWADVLAALKRYEVKDHRW